MARHHRIFMNPVRTCRMSIFRRIINHQSSASSIIIEDLGSKKWIVLLLLFYSMFVIEIINALLLLSGWMPYSGLALWSEDMVMRVDTSKIDVVVRSAQPASIDTRMRGLMIALQRSWNAIPFGRSPILWEMCHQRFTQKPESVTRKWCFCPWRIGFLVKSREEHWNSSNRFAWISIGVRTCVGW